MLTLVPELMLEPELHQNVDLREVRFRLPLNTLLVLREQQD